MNIFYLHEDPVQNAIWHIDKHIVKMPIEYAQLLSTAHRMLDGTETRRPSSTGKTMSKYWELDDNREYDLYKAVHMGHPCTVWTMQSHENYNWHYSLFDELCKEYTYRYNKVHASQTKLLDLLKNLPKNIKKSLKEHFQKWKNAFV